MPPLIPTLLRAYVRQGQHADAVFAEVERGCKGLLFRLPDAWHAGGYRSAHAVQDLADRVFFVCDRVPKGRYPFSGRVPFPCYVEEMYDTPVIRRHTFTARLSIARELMRWDYARACARDPALAWRAQVYRQVGAVLPQHADLVQTGDQHRRGSGQAVWRRQGAPALRLMPSREALVEALRAVPERNVDALVARALELLGAATQAALTDLVLEVLPPPSPSADAQEIGFESGEDGESHAVISTGPSVSIERLRIREALLDAWQRLSPPEQRLLRWVALGLTAREILERAPVYKDPPTLSHALGGINRQIKERLALAVGQPAQKTWGQTELAEMIFEALVACIGDDMEEAG